MKKRSLAFEQLEERVALHADVNLDGNVTAADVLALINRLQTPVIVGQFDNLDVNGDRKLTALDALIVINRIDRLRNALPAALTFSLGAIDTYGLTRNDVMWAINEAFEEYEDAADVDMRISSTGQFRISSRSIWLGGPYHARGQASGNQIWFHNGVLLPGQHNGALGPVDQIAYWRAMSSPQALKQILMHEIGHVTFFGDGHATLSDCVMHINAGTDQFCASERALLAGRYGPSQLVQTQGQAFAGIPTLSAATSAPEFYLDRIEDASGYSREPFTQAQNQVIAGGTTTSVTDNAASLDVDYSGLAIHHASAQTYIANAIHVDRQRIEKGGANGAGIVTTSMSSHVFRSGARKVMPAILPAAGVDDEGVKLLTETSGPIDTAREVNITVGDIEPA